MTFKGKLLRVIKGCKGMASSVIASTRSNLLEYRRLRGIKGRLRATKGHKGLSLSSVSLRGLSRLSLRGIFLSLRGTKQSFDKLKTGSRSPRPVGLAMTKWTSLKFPLFSKPQATLSNPLKPLTTLKRPIAPALSTLKKPLALALIFSLILGSIVIIAPWKGTPKAHAAWYAAGGTWNYRKAVTFTANAAKIPSTQTDFPVLISITDAGLAAHAKANGDDILFTSSDATTKLSHEIESYTSATGVLVAWVKVPSLATSGVLYMYYGNASATSQQNKTDVWSNGYSQVYHLGETGASTAGDYKNSTTSGSNSTNTTGQPVKTLSGKVGNAQTFNGTQYITTGNLGGLPSTGAISFWMNASSLASYPNSTTTNFNGSNAGIRFEENGATFVAVVGNNGGTFAAGSYPSISASTWYNVVLEWNTSTNKLIGYMNGAPAFNQDHTLWSSSILNFAIGNGYSSGRNWNGSLDETRISNIVRSADWIATEYANQNDPGSFYSLDTEYSGDVVAPSNPSSISGYSTSGKTTPITSGNFYNYPTPYFEWPAAEVAGGAVDTGTERVSGVAGYYSYFGTSCGGGGADPAASRGVLSDTGGGLHYSATTNVTVPDLTTNNGVYCLRMKTADNAGNVSAVTEQFVYNYDITAPNAPTFVAVNPAGYSSVNSFDFTWPASVDAVGSGASGVGGYQYKRGNGTDAWSATQAATSITAIASYQTGSNIFIVRSIDNAGNTSAQVQTTYYYSNTAPTKPTALASVPDMFSDTNSFSFSWTAPVHDRPIVSYGYSINAAPTTSNLTWTGSDATTLAADAYATVQGNNTIYLVAKDDSGAYALSDANVASLVFNCQTSAPPIPISITISDSSNRAYSTYSLTVKWNAGANQDAQTFDHYSVERSTNGTDFTELATTASTAYIDVSDLSNSTTYYYRIKAVDNANSPSAASTIVSRIPTGKYTTPPTIVQGPESTAKASTATIRWVTSRTATAGVRFGTKENELTRSQIDPTESTDHSITIPGLSGGTRYYYQVQSLDNDRDYSSDDAYSVTDNFDTLALPVIADVKISNITLTSADLSWTSSTASNTHLSYGTTINYGTGYEELDSYTTNHTYKLTGLSDSSTYHFKITGTDQDGNTLISDDYVFDTLPRPKISAVNFETDLSGSQPTSFITWTTNVATTSSVDYTPKDGSATYEESQSSYVTSHKVELSKLSDDTSYSFTVYGSDQFGNTTKSDEYSFATPFDSRPATISDVAVEASNVGLDKIDKAQLIVSWHTDELATTQVEYGQGVSGSYTSKTAEDKTLTNEHFVIVNDLISSTPYHLRAVSLDKGGNISMSEDVNSIPGDVPKSMLQTLLDTFENVFGWLGKLLG